MLIYNLKTLSDKENTYLWKVCSVSYPVNHLLAFRMHSSHVGPHPLPGDALDGKTIPINVEKNPSILLLLLRGMVRRRRGGLLPSAAAQEAVRAAALGTGIPAQLGRGGAGPARGVGSSH